MTTPTLHHELTFLRAQNARLKELLENYRDAASVDVLMSGPVLYGVSRSKYARAYNEHMKSEKDTPRGFMADEPKNWSEG